MTEQRYFQIREEYGIHSYKYPSKEQIALMTEEELRKQMKLLSELFQKVSQIIKEKGEF